MKLFHTYGLCPVRGLNLGRRRDVGSYGRSESELNRPSQSDYDLYARLVRFEITVRYEILWAKSTVRNYGTIYFPRYGTVRKYDIFVVLFSNLFRTNLIIERSPLRYVINQDLYRVCRVSIKYSKLYRVLHIVQKKKRPHPFPACLSSIGASYRRPSWRAQSQDFGLYSGLLIERLDF